MAPLTVLSLQTHAQTQDAVDARGGTVRLTDLNPAIGRWYLLKRGGEGSAVLHLETPEGISLALAPDGSALVARHGDDQRTCPLEGADGIADAAKSADAYTPACGGAVWLRQPARGQRSLLEAATDLLRVTGGAGEFLINFYKNNFNNTAEAAHYGDSGKPDEDAGEGPAAATLAPAWINRTINGSDLDIALVNAPAAGSLHIGTWYAAKAAPGIFAAVLTPEAAGAVGEPGHANDAYFVAWDLARYRLGYAVGTAHPALGWSDRAPAPHIGPGPDGFDNATPLARVGMVPPYDRRQLVGTFAGGFKRDHGAFRVGENAGLHYGFEESGVVLSRLQPRMVTLLATADGTPQLRDLTDAEVASDGADFLFARQAGYALLSNFQDAAHLNDINGNWSGSNEGHLLTMRSGVCLMPSGGTTYLVYGVFSAATPRAMAFSFKSFGCRDAALLDMNNPYLVYSAVYRRDAGRLAAEHLIKPMAKADENGTLKFVDVPDSRDLFYVTRRTPG